MEKNYKITVLAQKAASSSSQVASDATGGKVSIQIDITRPTGLKPLKWLYVDGTPDWAVDAAKAVGYDVQKI